MDNLEPSFADALLYMDKLGPHFGDALLDIVNHSIREHVLCRPALSEWANRWLDGQDRSVVTIKALWHGPLLSAGGAAQETAFAAEFAAKALASADQEQRWASLALYWCEGAAWWAARRKATWPELRCELARKTTIEAANRLGDLGAEAEQQRQLAIIQGYLRK